MNGIIPKKGKKNYPNINDQPVPLLAQKRRKYETILRCIQAQYYL